MAAGREPAGRELGFPVAGHELLTAGRNARTWRVFGSAGVAVAKLVEPGDASLGQFVGSLRVAAALDSGDLPTAPPLPSRDGLLAVPAGSGLLAVLPWLDGRPLNGTAGADLDRMGAVLATLHRRAAGIPVPGGIPSWPWSWLSLDALGLEPLDPGDGAAERDHGRPKHP
jgi:Ser/Thr protein kinase RdoA (MazF antagonist)